MDDESLQIFTDEVEDLLGVAEQALLNLDDLDNKADTLENINELFRTFHTIKGSSGLFGLNSIVEFTHVVESLLGRVREESLTVDEDMVSLFLLSTDHLTSLVSHELGDSSEISGALKSTDESLIKRLNVYLDIKDTDKTAEINDSTQETSRENADDSEDQLSTERVANQNWHISLRFRENALRNGMDPASFIAYLGKIGELISVVLIDDAIPAWEEFDAENCYLGFEIDLSAPNSNKEEIEEVFEFVQDDCLISILPPNSHINSYIKIIEELPESDMRIGEILVSCGALTQLEKQNILNAQDQITDDVMSSGQQNTVPPLGQIAVNQNVIEQQVVDAAIKKQSDQKHQRASGLQTIRVNALKLESLVNLVGELVISSANTDLNARRLADTDMNEAMENLLRLIEGVRDTALGLRMVQIGETFNRYKRIVREVSRDLGKEIDLHISGAETELDKTLIEKIGDPLMHLVRNAIDHGIESPETRISAGKPAKGTVSLDAFHDSGSIVIQIRDDGGGLSKHKILAKAQERGLLEENSQLSDQQIYRLIFEAGFSTADKVSNLSGRGVGMDVVRKNIESLRGQVDIESEEGQGSTISIRLPLTLAIIDGFQIRVGNAQYIVPLDMVDECIELNDSLRGEGEHANYINLRGEILPYMYLSDIFFENKDKNQHPTTNIENKPLSNNKKQTQNKLHRDNIVVVRVAGKKAGFVVDELLGEHQTVIKPLGKVFQNLKGISGATILGSGEVAMIIDIPEMIKRVIKTGKKHFKPPNVIH